MFPFAIKIFYGLISDNIPFIGTRRKSYLILMSFVQFFSLFLVFALDIKNMSVLTFLVALSSMSLAFQNVAIDAVMVV